MARYRRCDCDCGVFGADRREIAADIFSAVLPAHLISEYRIAFDHHNSLKSRPVISSDF